MAPLIALLSLGCAGTSEQPQDSAALETIEMSVATWKGSALGAYTLGHDDACESATSGLFAYAEPELRKRGLRAAFGAIVATCEQRNTWADLERLIADGHEILNHSWSHKNLVQETRDFGQEVATAKLRLDENLSRPTTFFIFPYDEFDEMALEAVRAAGHRGARAGIRGVNSPGIDEFAVRFDVYGPQYSIYANDPSKSQNVLDALVDDAIAAGGWAFRELHGVEDSSWESVSLAEYQRHLTYIQGLADAYTLWVDGPSAIIAYRRAVQVCGAPRMDGMTMHFPEASEECAALAIPLTVELSLDPAVDQLVVSQAGRRQPARKLAPGEFSAEIMPSAEGAELSEN